MTSPRYSATEKLALPKDSIIFPFYIISLSIFPFSSLALIQSCYVSLCDSSHNWAYGSKRRTFCARTDGSGRSCNPVQIARDGNNNLPRLSVWTPLRSHPAYCCTAPCCWVRSAKQNVVFSVLHVIILGIRLASQGGAGQLSAVMILWKAASGLAWSKRSKNQGPVVYTPKEVSRRS